MNTSQGSLAANISFFPTPLADEGRKRMFDSLMAEAARTVNHFYHLLPFLEQDSFHRSIQTDFARPSSAITSPVNNYFSKLSGPTGYSLATIFTDVPMSDEKTVQNQADHRDAPIFSPILTSAQKIMQLGVNNENWLAIPGVRMNLTIPNPPPPFTFNFAETSVRTHVPAGKARGFLLHQRQLARDAAARGNPAGKEQAIKAFIDELSTHTGINVPAEQATTPLFLVRSL